MKNDIIPFYNASNKIISSSKDCYLYDSEGGEYIDFESGVWCTNIGHGNEQLIKEATKQLKKSIHHGYHFRNEQAENLSAKLQQLIGFEMGSSVFLSSGSESVNLSITLAKHVSGKKKILKIDNSFLSSYGYGQISDENDSLVSVKYNDIESISKIDFKNIAALVLELGGASIQMVRFPSKEFIRQLIETCKQNNCLIIAEEVTTGMGRLGEWFGFQAYDFIPDMVVLGKGLGNGFPISALTINNKLATHFQEAPLRYAQSHQNDPFGCSIALETIKIIETDKLIERSRIIGSYFYNQLCNLKNNHPTKVKEIRACGCMLAIELAEAINGELINQNLFESGLVVGFKLNTFRFLPPLTIQESDIDKLIRKLDAQLK